LNERPPASLDSSYRKLTLTKGDLNAVLIQTQGGHGTITILRPEVNAARPLAQPKTTSVGSSPLEIEETIIPQNVGVQDQEERSEIASTPVAAKYPEAKPEPDSQSTTVAPPPSNSISEEKLDALADFAAHIIQPSAYAIPPQHDSPSPQPREEAPDLPAGTRGFPTSIPRAKPVEQLQAEAEESVIEQDAPPDVPVEPASKPGRARRRRNRSNAPAVATRQVAKAMVGGIQTGRRLNDRIGTFLHKFAPRLLPGGDANQPFAVPTYVLVLIAVFIPAIVVTIASLVYFRFGQSLQFNESFAQAGTARAQAISESDPARQRDEWQKVLGYLNEAEKYRDTEESRALRSEAQASLDSLMGIMRLEFIPAFPNGLGNTAQISHMAASESDLYMLEAEGGKILHATFTGKSLQLDNAFDCQPGTYGGYQVESLVDLVALPKANAVNATVMGVDASGTVLYCAPNQVPQAIPLPALPNTNWGRITSISLDSGNLYVLDAPSRAVWVFIGKDSTFTDTPYFYFGNEIPANIESAIDLSANGDDIFMLHSDGHLSTCMFSRLSDAPTRCQDPAPWVDNYPAHQDANVFQLAHFTQLSLTSAPNSVILLLDSENQSVFRFSPRSFELQNQIMGYAGKANPFKRGSMTAMAVSPNYVLYLAIGDQVYFATNMP
jgi:hypothetical protein